MAVLWVLLFGTGAGYGQTLDDYLVMAAENNPGLKAQFNAYLSSLEKVPQVGALPDPQVSFGLFVRPMERYVGNQVLEMSAMQMFPWFGTLGAAKDEAALMAKAKYEAFQEAKTMVFYEVKATWYALFLLEREIAIAEENVQILKTLEALAINRFKSGDASGAPPLGGGQMEKSSGASRASSGMGGMGGQGESAPSGVRDMRAGEGMGEMRGGGQMVDVLRIQMEINELKNKLALLEDSRTPLIAQFNRLLNRATGETVALPDSMDMAMMPVPIAEIPDSIRRNNPMLMMLEKEEKAFLAQKEMNRKMGFPMIGIGLQYSVFQQRPGGESMMNGRNMWMPMATVTIPLWRKKYRASVREAELMREAVIAQRRDVGHQLLVSYEEALKDFRDAERRRALFYRQTAIAQQALDILTVQYATAGSAFEEVLRMQQQLLDYRLRGLYAVVDQHVAVAMVERLMGR